MEIFSNLGRYSKSSIKHSSPLDFADAICLIGILLFWPVVACEGAWYFFAIIVAADIVRFLSRGAWYFTPRHKTSHWHNPSKDVNTTALIVVRATLLFILFAMKLPELLIDDTTGSFNWTRSWLWYIIAMTAIFEAFRCLLHTIHKYNPDWLWSTGGRIGAANWISIARIAVAITLPHIYITQSFGDKSNLVATIFLVVTIGTDAVDGYVARQTKSVTKVGKYLDPLGDKAIFAPNAVAFIWLLYQRSSSTSDKVIFAITCALVLIAVGRDLLFFLWFFIMGRKIPRGIGASPVDKLRMTCICAWLLSTAIMLSTHAGSAINTRMRVVSYATIVCVALLSLISVNVDSARLRRALRRQRTAR